MSLRSSPFRLGDVAGVRFDGDDGDVLPKHVHDEQTNHFTIVARGSLQVWNEATGKVFLKAGAMVDFDPFVSHEFTCLEDNTRFYQIAKKHVD